VCIGKWFDADLTALKKHFSSLVVYGGYATGAFQLYSFVSPHLANIKTVASVVEIGTPIASKAATMGWAGLKLAGYYSGVCCTVLAPGLPFLGVFFLGSLYNKYGIEKPFGTMKDWVRHLYFEHTTGKKWFERNKGDEKEEKITVVVNDSQDNHDLENMNVQDVFNAGQETRQAILVLANQPKPGNHNNDRCSGGGGNPFGGDDSGEVLQSEVKKSKSKSQKKLKDGGKERDKENEGQDFLDKLLFQIQAVQKGMENFAQEMVASKKTMELFLLQQPAAEQEKYHKAIDEKNRQFYEQLEAKFTKIVDERVKIIIQPLTKQLDAIVKAVNEVHNDVTTVGVDIFPERVIGNVVSQAVMQACQQVVIPVFVMLAMQQQGAEANSSNSWIAPVLTYGMSQRSVPYMPRTRIPAYIGINNNEGKA